MSSKDLEMPTTPNVPYAMELDEEIVNVDDETESIIQYFLEAYKNYLVQCIDYKDLLFYKYFSPAKRKEFRGLAKLKDGESVTRIMIDTILPMSSVSDRFAALVKLFEEEFGNEKVLRILKGEKVPSDRLENKERIQRVCMKEICERLCVTEIIPELLRQNLIVVREGEYLLKRARSGTNFDAVVDLLLILPSRHTNWYGRFMYCLINTSHEELAERVDKDLYQRILANKEQAEKSTDEYEGSNVQMIEEMSLVSGPMKTCTSYLELKLKHNHTLNLDSEKQNTLSDKHPGNKEAKKTHGEDFEEATTHNSPTKSSERSPNEERVAQWITASKIEGDDPDLEKDVLRRKYQTSRRKLNPGRTSSLVKNSFSASQTDSGSKTYRHATIQVPFSQIRQLTNNLNELTPAKTLLESNRFDQWYGSDDSSSRASDLSSIDQLCVDNIEALDLNNRCLERTRKYPLDLRTVFSLGNADSRIDIKDKNEDGKVRKGTTKPGKTPESHEQTHSHSSQRDQSTFSTLEQLFSISNLHPVKILIILKDHWELNNDCKRLSWMSNRAMYLDDDVSSLKYHYVLTVIQQAKDAENLDVLINKLLTGRESDGNYEFQDQLVRHVLEGFPHKESRLLKKILAQLKMSDVGDGLASLKILIQGLNKDQSTTEELEVGSASDDKMVYASSKASQVLHGASSKVACHYSSIYFVDADTPFKVNDGASLKEVRADDPEYQNIVYHVEKASKKLCKIIAIQCIQNRTLLVNYTQFKERLMVETSGSPHECLLFASASFVNSLIKKGVGDEKRDQICQNDIYLADYPVLSEQLKHGVTSASSRGSHRCVLLCRVLLGKTLTSSTSTCPIPKGYHSVKQYPIYRVLSANQVNPQYLVTLGTEHTNT